MLLTLKYHRVAFVLVHVALCLVVPQVSGDAFDLVAGSTGPFPHRGVLLIYLRVNTCFNKLCRLFLPLLNGELCLFLLFALRAQSNDAALAFRLGDWCCCSLAS